MKDIIYYKNHKIMIVEQEFYESPDDWGNEDIFLVYDHRSFMVKRKGFEPKDIYDYIISLQHPNDEFDVIDYSEYWIFPVEAYIHSGVTLSLSGLYGPKTCQWDSSITGFVLVKKSDFPTEEEANTRAENLITTWNQYLSGDVYGYIIEKPTTIYSIEKSLFDKHLLEGTTIKDLVKDFMIDDDWEELDSCWGYYGDPNTSGLLDEAKSIIDCESDKV